MVDHRKRLTTNIVFLLSSLSVVDGCSYFYSAALALENPAGILDSSGHNETQCICLQGKTKAYCSKESTGPLLSRPGWASQTVYMRKSCLAYPGYPTCRGETTRLPELSHPPHVNGWYNFLNKWVEKYLAQGNSGEGLSRLAKTM